MVRFHPGPLMGRLVERISDLVAVPFAGFLFFNQGVLWAGSSRMEKHISILASSRLSPSQIFIAGTYLFDDGRLVFNGQGSNGINPPQLIGAGSAEPVAEFVRKFPGAELVRISAYRPIN